MSGWWGWRSKKLNLMKCTPCNWSLKMVHRGHWVVDWLADWSVSQNLVNIILLSRFTWHFLLWFFWQPNSVSEFCRGNLITFCDSSVFSYFYFLCSFSTTSIDLEIFPVLMTLLRCPLVTYCNTITTVPMILPHYL